MTYSWHTPILFVCLFESTPSQNSCRYLLDSYFKHLWRDNLRPYGRNVITRIFARCTARACVSRVVKKFDHCGVPVTRLEYCSLESLFVGLCMNILSLSCFRIEIDTSLSVLVVHQNRSGGADISTKPEPATTTPQPSAALTGNILHQPYFRIVYRIFESQLFVTSLDFIPEVAFTATCRGALADLQV